MILIDKEKLINDLDGHLKALPEPEDWQAFIMDAIKGIVNEQPEIKIPDERGADQCDVPSGYWFDKGWDACREEILTHA